MSEFIASAEIAIIPNTRDFRTQLRTQLAEATKKPVPIKIAVDPAGFERQLRTAVRTASENVRANILVRADTTGFERDLRTKVKAVAERVSANVRVTAGPVQGAARGGGGAARPRRPAAVLSDTGQPLFGAAAAAKTEARAREKARLDALKKIQAAEVAAHAENLKRDRARAEADRRARQKVLADLEKQGLLSRTGRPLTGAARDARLEAQERVKAQQAAIAEIQAAEEAAHKEDLRRTRRRIAAERTAQQELRRNALRGQTGVADTPERIAAQAQARRVLTKAQTASITIANAEIGAMNALEAARAREAAAQALATEATVARQTAERLGLKTTAAAIAAEETLALERLQTEQANLKAAAGEVELGKRRAFGARGLVAQLATFAGLRGAVLSANAAFIAGTVAAIAFGKAVQSAASFTSQLSVFGVTAGATADEMEAVAAAAVRLGRDVTLPGVSAAEAAEAMTNLAKAGLSVENSLAGARGVLQLATAAQISNAEATELAASALNAFGLAGTEAIRVADVFANSANLAQGSIVDVGIALQQSAAVARQVGVSFEDTVALLTLLARNGIRGSDAGTSLRVAFTRLIAPTDEAAEVLRKLNVQVRDAQGNLRPEVFADIATAMSNMSRAQQDANAKIIFGVDALRSYSIIAREGLGSLSATRTALDEQGTAADLANARMTGLTGAAENLKNQLSSLGLILGGLVTGPLTHFANQAAGILQIINGLAGGLISLGKSAKEALVDLKEFATIEIGGFEISPFQGITEPLSRLNDLNDLITNQFSKSLFEARTQTVGLIQEFNKVGGATKLNETIGDLRALQTELQGGNEESQAFAKSIGALIEEIQEKSADADVDLGEMKLEIPPELLRGDPGRLAAEAAKRAFREEIDKPFTVELDPTFNLASRFTQQGKDAFKAAAEAWRATIRAEIAKIETEITRATGRLLGLERQALDIDLGGGSLQEQLANARRQEAEAARIVRARERQFARGNVAEETVRRAKERLAEARSLREGIQDEIKAEAKRAKDDAEAAAKEAQRLLNEADQALLDSFAPAERRVQRQATLASQTPGLKDDIAAARARKRQLLKQIAVIRADFNDRKAAAEEIFKRRQEIADIEERIRNDTVGLRDVITENLGKRIELAQLQGNKGAILKAIDRAIKDAKDRVKRWKALGLSLLDEQIALARLIRDRKEFLKELQGEESPDVFANRLFTEAADQFRRFGSNISTSRTGVLAPQDARGVFARNLLAGGGNITNLTDNLAQRTRESQLAEERKQTTYLRIIAGGQKTKFVRGAPIPPEAARTVANIGANILRGL